MTAMGPRLRKLGIFGGIDGLLTARHGGDWREQRLGNIHRGTSEALIVAGSPITKLGCKGYKGWL